MNSAALKSRTPRIPSGILPRPLDVPSLGLAAAAGAHRGSDRDQLDELQMSPEILTNE